MLIIKANSDSVITGDHESILFVPRKDAAKELWDGPRSGADGATVLTGVDAAFNSNEVQLGSFVIEGKHKTNWCFLSIINVILWKVCRIFVFLPPV